MKRRLALGGLLICGLVLVSTLFAHPVANVLVFSDTDGEMLTANHSGQIITNAAATGSQTFDLPPAATGLHFLFAVAAAQKMVVSPESGNLFVGTGIDPAPAAGDALESDTVVGTLIEIVAIDSTKWLQIRKVGSWTVGE
jgi:hypothetical protein